MGISAFGTVVTIIVLTLVLWGISLVAQKSVGVIDRLCRVTKRFLQMTLSYLCARSVVHWESVALPFAVSFENWPQVSVTILCFSLGKTHKNEEVIP